MNRAYKLGDRVRLLTNGGFGDCIAQGLIAGGHGIVIELGDNWIGIATYGPDVTQPVDSNGGSWAFYFEEIELDN